MDSDNEYDIILVDEFDALDIQVKIAERKKSLTPASSSSVAAATTSSSASASPASSLPHTPSSAGASISAAKKEASAPFELPKRPVESVWHESRMRETLGKYPAKTHARKVAAELGAKHGLVFLPGQEDKLYEDSDMGPEFRQRRYFYYLSGANFAGCAVTYDIARDYLTLWIPYTDPRTKLWYGTTPSIEETKARVDIDDVRHINGLDRFLYLALGPGSTLFVLHPEQTPKLQSTKGALHIDTARLRPAMDSARVIKTDYEVAMIRRANAVSSGAHRAILSRLKRLANEREIDAIFRGFSQAHGAKYQAYPVIAGAGVNAGTLHYWQNDQPLEGRQLVCIDAGAEWDCYASDVTRTIPINGKFTPEAKAIYDIVARMQEECISRIKPGLVFYTLHLHASAIAIAGLLKLGILHNGTQAEIFSRGTIAAFFPHGLGHGVGLEVHDVNGAEKLMLGTTVGNPMRVLNARRGAAGKREWVSPEMIGVMYRDAVTTPPPYKGRAKLEKNMVVTVEPGIYFCREYIEAYFLENPMHAKYINTDVLAQYYDVGGVRIEDCILVTDSGYENLTTAPKGEEALQIINGQ